MCSWSPSSSRHGAAKNRVIPGFFLGGIGNCGFPTVTPQLNFWTIFRAMIETIETVEMYVNACQHQNQLLWDSSWPIRKSIAWYQMIFSQFETQRLFLPFQLLTGLLQINDSHFGWVIIPLPGLNHPKRAAIEFNPAHTDWWWVGWCLQGDDGMVFGMRVAPKQHKILWIPTKYNGEFLSYLCGGLLYHHPRMLKFAFWTWNLPDISRFYGHRYWGWSSESIRYTALEDGCSNW